MSWLHIFLVAKAPLYLPCARKSLCVVKSLNFVYLQALQDCAFKIIMGIGTSTDSCPENSTIILWINYGKKLKYRLICSSDLYTNTAPTGSMLNERWTVNLGSFLDPVFSRARESSYFDPSITTWL